MQKKIIILLLIIVVLLAFYIGFLFGVKTTVEEIVKMGLILIEKKKINIDIDEQMIINGILQYKNNIGGCLFLENKTLELK